MKIITRLTLSFAIMLYAAFAQMPGQPQFSADMKMTNQHMPDGMTGKLFFDAGKMRMDMQMAAGRGPMGGNVSMIHNGATKTSYMLMNDEKMYMEMKSNGRMGRGPRMPDVRHYTGNPCETEEGMTCKKVGEETVNGRDCEKWEFTSASDPSKNHTAWIDKKLHIPVKNVSAESTFELSNIKEGAQDKKLFEVPSDYQKFDPASMMGGRGPGM